MDAEGTFVGTWTFEGKPVVSTDHQTYLDDAARRLTTRDTTNTITEDELVPAMPPILATRVVASPDSLVFSSFMPPATPMPAKDADDDQESCFFCP